MIIPSISLRYRYSLFLQDAQSDIESTRENFIINLGLFASHTIFKRVSNFLNLQGCCGPMYSGETSSQLYYLNNFDNIFRSYVTLFELMVVNNWFIIMDGIVSVTSGWSRVYFMLFYIIAVVGNSWTQHNIFAVLLASQQTSIPKMHFSFLYINIYFVYG